MAGFTDFLQNLATSFSAPERLLGGAAQTLGTLADPTFRKAIFSPQELSLGEAQQIMQFKPSLLTEEEFQRAEREGGLMTGLRGAAGLGEHALTFGTPTGAGGQALTGMIGNILSSPIQRGAIEGTLGTFGAGGGGMETALGGLFGAGGGAAGELIGKGLGKLGEGAEFGPARVGGFLQEKGQELQKNALKRMIGVKPTMKEGGIGLIDDVFDLAKNRNFDITSPDDALLLSGQLFDEWGSVVRDEATQLAQQGKKIDIQGVLDGLVKKRNKALTSDKGAIDNVINDITQWISQNGDDALSGYRLKQLLGDKGKWSPAYAATLTPTGKAAYEDAYKAISDQFEAKDFMGKRFREANKNVELSMKLKNWAGRAQNSVLPAGINWSDPTQDLGIAGTIAGTLAGGPVAGGLTGAAAAGTGKFLKSPEGAQKIGGLLERIGQGQIPGVPGLAGQGEQLSQILGRGGIQAGQALQGLMGGGQPQDTLQQQQMPQQGLGDILGAQAAGGMGTMGAPTQGMPMQQPQQPVSQQVSQQTGGISPDAINQIQQLALLQEIGVPSQQLIAPLMQALSGGAGQQDVQSYSQGVERGLIDIGKVPKEIQGSVLQDLLGRGAQIPTAEGKITEAQRTFSSVQQGAQEALNLVEQGVKTGPLSTILGKAGEKVGVAGAGTDLRALLSNLNSMLKSEIFGASVSPQEMKSLQDSVPSPTDQESVIKTKLKRLIQRMETMR